MTEALEALPPPGDAGDGGAPPDPDLMIDDLIEWLCQEIGTAIGTPATAVPSGKPLTALGLDSLAAVDLQQAVLARHGAALTLEELLEGPTVAQLAETIVAARQPSPKNARAAEARAGSVGRFPLSRGQRALWFLARLAPGSPAYHIAAAARILSPVDSSALERAVGMLADRHPALRTTFGDERGEPFQQVQPQASPTFLQEDAAGWSERELEARLQALAYQPFDLAGGSLLRVCLWTGAAGGPLLLLAIHHLVADFHSLEILFHDLGELYEMVLGGESTPELPAPPPTYTSYIAWQEQRLAGREGERLWEYWRQALAGVPTVLDLPLDRPRPYPPSYRGAVERLRLGPEITLRGARLLARQGGTLFVLLLGALEAALARHTGQEDLLLGSPA
ncbi:MAG TPA: condensation domain-containing protein, partial [Fimbriimonadaceae bacterium]|nr:condensation domain-containing protein [Fimbriimonadaceae bacterium]